MSRRKPSQAELRTLQVLIDTFGADIILHQERQTKLDARDRFLLRKAVSKRAVDAHAALCSTEAPCTADSTNHAPILPAYSLPALGRRGRVAVIGPCPVIEDVDDVARGGQLGGVASQASKLLNRTMKQHGLDPDMVSWLHASWCFSPQQPGSRLNRGPQVHELNWWHPHLLRALDAADVEYVLLHGSHATRAWRPDVRLQDVRGGMFLWNQRWFVQPINHASNASRVENRKASDAEWAADVAKFVERVTEDQGLKAITDEGICNWCTKQVSFYGWDADGIGYCEEHFKAKMGARGRAQKKAKKNAVLQQEQGTLNV